MGASLKLKRLQASFNVIRLTRVRARHAWCGRWRLPDRSLVFAPNARTRRRAVQAAIAMATAMQDALIVPSRIWL